MLRTLECEAAVFGCSTVEPDGDDPGCMLAALGADHLLDRIPDGKWGIVVPMSVDDARHHLTEAELPVPKVIIAGTPDGPSPEQYQAAADALAADPLFCLALEDTADGVEAALKVGMKVLGIATKNDPETLAAADMVVPSLRSLHVVGTHPVLVLEVDALPNLGTFHPGQIKRR